MKYQLRKSFTILEKTRLRTWQSAMQFRVMFVRVLPHEETVVHGQFRDRQTFLPVTAVIEDVFKMILVLGYVDHRRLFREAPHHGHLVPIDSNTGEKDFEEVSG